MLLQLKSKNFYFVFLADLVLFLLAHIGAYYTRFEFKLTETEIRHMMSALPYILPFKALVFMSFGLYRGMYRYTSVSDMWSLIKASVLSSVVIITVLFLIHQFSGYSRTVFILDGGFTLFLTGAFRVYIRYLYQQQLFGKEWKNAFFNVHRQDQKPVFIVGAGDAGEKTLREILDNPRLPFRVTGFIDDNVHKHGRAIHGVPVIGGIAALCEAKIKYGVSDVLIAMPSAPGPQIRKVVEACEACGIQFKTLPGMGELIDGKVSLKALRDVNYADLLGRAPVELDMEEISRYIKGNRILVTGAGGSIGSELCRQIVKFHPEELILLDNSETNLFNIQMEIQHRVRYQHFTTIFGNVANPDLTERTLNRYDPHVIFHAAAFKHVPLLEVNPWEAVRNNIMGSKVLIQKAVEKKVDKFVLVSTDKAVRPENIMGASKRVCELLMQSYTGNGTRMMSVRFGNVVGSSGSVIPIFRDQIARGESLTVTHPEVTRYFMTIPEAARLILQAGAIGSGGEIFILDMGTPVKIVDMARDLIRLSGKEPGRDIDIVFTGLRPGEKLYEELITDGEGIVPTSHKKILVIQHNGKWNGLGSQEAYKKWLLNGVDDLYRLAEKQDGCGIKDKLKELVPEYKAQECEYVL
ncbi:MAG: nucleoside-diphosphate sugar epimerase/dehydratase [Desulfobacterales bacterium]|nr:nucleoside-diphosphate sugar epimerase/dehydratase [Desulfobacterales bacterium]